MLVLAIGKLDGKRVFICATTSEPWRMNAALRKRFVTRIYFGPPSREERAALFQKQFMETKTELEQSDFEECAALTEGFSCSDIVSIVRDAQMEPVRRIQRATHFKKVREEYH